MKYIKVKWSHDSSQYPVMLYSELNENMWEVRKVEIYADGRVGFASGEEHFGSTELGMSPIPAIEEIALDPQFEPVSISAPEFERIWEKARAEK